MIALDTLREQVDVAMSDLILAGRVPAEHGETRYLRAERSALLAVHRSLVVAELVGEHEAEATEKAITAVRWAGWGGAVIGNETPDPRLAALLADPDIDGELATLRVAIAGHMQPDHAAGVLHILAGLPSVFLRALDRSAPETPDDTIRVCRMCFTEPPHHAEGCDYTNLVRVK